MLFASFCAQPAGMAVALVSLWWVLSLSGLWVLVCSCMALLVAGLLIAGFMDQLVALLICSACYCSLLSSSMLSSACCAATLLSMRKIKPPLRSLRSFVILPVFRYKAEFPLSIITGYKLY